MPSDPKRVPLFERLPEIYRIRDAEQFPPDQLREYLAAIEQAFGALHENIESLYHDLFIETCDEWVIPYLADLVGTTHLKGDPRTLRAEVADTIALRRRKGTLTAIERLVADLTGWATHTIELRERLGWTQQLNHLRPDPGSPAFIPPPDRTRFDVPRGGTVPIRDPATLSLVDTAFDPCGRTIDVRTAGRDALRYNLPNLAIYLWRLRDYRLRVLRPLSKGTAATGATGATEAAVVARFDLHPLDRPVQLFNTYRHDPHAEPPRLAELDQVPGPILSPRLTSGSNAGNPLAYISVDTYDATVAPPAGIDLGETGIQIYLPQATFAGVTWTFRGDNLCGWESGLRRRAQVHEIIVDPRIGRLVIGAGSQAEADTLAAQLLVGWTYGALGEVGAHPVSRAAAITELNGEAIDVRPVNGFLDPAGLQTQLSNIHHSLQPILIEIQDSLVHDLDPNTLPGATNLDGPIALRLNRSLIIRAASGQRPIIRLANPLRFRPTKVVGATAAEQEALANHIANLLVRFEGVQLSAGPTFPSNQPLIARAAVARLEILDSTLDPGGFRRRNGTRAPLQWALGLAKPRGFADPAEEKAFAPTPDVLVQHSITGALRIDGGYTLALEDAVVDAGAGPGEDATSRFAIAPLANPDTTWGPPLTAKNATLFGRVRLETLRGRGVIFVHQAEVWNNQTGCIKQSYFRGLSDRLPPNPACVKGTEARLALTSTWFGDPGYAQLSLNADARILTRGPGDDEMGAFNALREAHKWANLQIRFREFMPVGVRPLLISVT